MKRTGIWILLCLLFVGSALAAQDGKMNGPKKQKAAPVDCSNANDATITAGVKERIAKAASLKDAIINVKTEQGVVTLTGQVKLGRNKGLATLQAKRAACVKKVINQLTVEQSAGSSSMNK